MQNNSTIIPFLATGVLFIFIALLLAWSYGDNAKFAVSSFVLIVAGGACCILSCIKYLKARDEQDFFHLD